jgi:hypothetical protein
MVAPCENTFFKSKQKTTSSARSTTHVMSVDKVIRNKLAFYANLDIFFFSQLISAFDIICPLSKGQTITFSIGNNNKFSPLVGRENMSTVQPSLYQLAVQLNPTRYGNTKVMQVVFCTYLL